MPMSTVSSLPKDDEIDEIGSIYSDTSSSRSSSCSSNSRSSSCNDKRYLDVVKGKKGYVGVGDVVSYLGQLVCVIISICSSAENNAIVICRGIDIDTMTIDDTSQLSFEANKVCLSPIKITPSLRKILNNKIGIPGYCAKINCKFIKYWILFNYRL